MAAQRSPLNAAAAGSAAMVAGLFGPWAIVTTASATISIAGTDGDDTITLASGGVALVAIELTGAQRRPGAWS